MTTTRPATSATATVRAGRRRETWAAYGFLSPWIIGFLVFTAGPMIASLVLSFTDYDGISAPHGRRNGQLPSSCSPTRRSPRH